MPQQLQHIDQIAREKNRDVLFLHFERYQEDQEGDDPIREIVVAWLEDHGIPFEPCMGLEQEGFVDVYAGDLYIDLAVDENDPIYQALCEYLEDDEGNMRLDGVLFFVLALELALEIEAERQIQHDDEPPVNLLS
ncbi:hypothetical protein [Acinetobacter shaoyimingii]|uniref:Uncharacterized protein n=1 Tax=Acinetobacter shaoyimingii TaxID=2715164 RepID=A0A6G8RXH7_9GAMM|nr:hypothetical protein [Acinetobacter shaoyimingii]QIO06508.1 hypothetical protein G8E00_11365 [Acinetobacter shaoyimingii]